MFGILGLFGEDYEAYLDTKRDCNYDPTIFRTKKKGEIEMINNNINQLESLNNEALDNIIEQIESIKKNRRELECYKIVDELNVLLNQISNILQKVDSSYGDSYLLGECRFLINNTFIVDECDGEKCWIDLEYC